MGLFSISRRAVRKEKSQECTISFQFGKPCAVPAGLSLVLSLPSTYVLGYLDFVATRLGLFVRFQERNNRHVPFAKDDVSKATVGQSNIQRGAVFQYLILC